MIKKFVLSIIITMTLFTTAAFAQDLPRIAVYVTGDVPENERTALGTRMLAALVNSGRYMGIERSAAFVAEIEREQVTQRSGAIDDDQISALGKQFGVKYVCIAAITPAYGSYQVSARIVDVETAVVAFIGESHSPLETMDDLTAVSDRIVENMFGTVSSTVPTPPASIEGMTVKSPPKTTFWIAIGFDAIAAGMLAYGIYENSNTTSHDSRKDAERAKNNRNAAYAIGAAALLSGITIHIFF